MNRALPSKGYKVVTILKRYQSDLEACDDIEHLSIILDHLILSLIKVKDSINQEKGGLNDR